MRNYTYKITECDVPGERRSTLESYRAKRQLWLRWVEDDDHHAIWTTLSSMVWRDVAFNVRRNFTVGNDENALNILLWFEKLDKPIMQAGGETAAYKLWRQLSAERNAFLNGVDAGLIGNKVGNPSRI